jgi:hypothetical protein
MIRGRALFNLTEKWHERFQCTAELEMGMPCQKAFSTSGLLTAVFIHELLMEFLQPRYNCWYFVLLWQDRASEVPCSWDLHSTKNSNPTENMSAQTQQC